MEPANATATMRFMPIILASMTLVSTGLGGMAAVRFRDPLYFLSDSPPAPLSRWR